MTESPPTPASLLCFDDLIRYLNVLAYLPTRQGRKTNPLSLFPSLLRISPAETHVPFFSQYAQVFNPWAPDSRSFIYVTPSGLSHTPLVGSKHCLGEDRWQNQGASFGVWSRS